MFIYEQIIEVIRGVENYRGFTVRTGGSPELAQRLSPRATDRAPHHERHVKAKEGEREVL